MSLDIELFVNITTISASLILTPSYYIQTYCVGAAGMCTDLYTVVSGDFCSLIESKTDVSDATLRSLNPWINTNCGTLSLFLVQYYSALTWAALYPRRSSSRAEPLYRCSWWRHFHHHLSSHFHYYNYEFDTDIHCPFKFELWKLVKVRPVYLFHFPK